MRSAALQMAQGGFRLRASCTLTYRSDAGDSGRYPVHVSVRSEGTALSIWDGSRGRLNEPGWIGPDPPDLRSGAQPQLAWSPDATLIACESDSDPTGEFSLDICVMNSDGSQKTRITENPKRDTDPEVRP